ncbi:MAG: thiamine-binding protein [Bacteroidota bacterium]
MEIAVEISMYPLTGTYIPPIQAFIDGLHTNPALSVSTNNMSTHIYGPYDAVMELLQKEIKPVFEQDDTVVMVIKMINKNLEKAH